MTTATEPTLLEKVHALKVTALRLAAERDQALAERTDLLEANRRLRAERDVAVGMASQATKDLVRARGELAEVREESEARLALHVNLISSLRISSDAKDAKIRQLSGQLCGLAVADEDLQRQLDAAQQEPKPTRPSWWSRRIGNQL